MKLIIKSSIREFDPIAWRACAGDHPYLQYGLFLALEDSQSCTPERCVISRFFALIGEHDELIACAPAMIKRGHKREFGPEILWLQEGIQKGCFEWPKFQIGVPFFPTSSPKLLVNKNYDQATIEKIFLKSILTAFQHSNDYSVFNIMNIDPSLASQLAAEGWLISYEKRCLWKNQSYINYGDYEDHLPHRKRYAVQKERRKAKSFGLEFKVLQGAQIKKAFWSEFYRGHQKVCREYGNTPWLSEQFHLNFVENIAPCVRVFAAFREGKYVAAVLGFIDSKTLYLETWSTVEELPHICFELLCHMPIEYAINHNLDQIDSGVYAAHKASRGFLEDLVPNAHWFKDSRLKALAQHQLKHLNMPT